MSCFQTRIIQLPGGAGSGGGPYTVTPNSPALGQATITDTTSGNSFILNLNDATTLSSADNSSFVQVVDGVNDSILFQLNGTPVGNVQIIAGTPKWTLNGILDPVRYRATPVTTVQRDTLTPLAGDLIYNSTTVKFEYYNGTAWVPMDNAAANTTFTPIGNIVATNVQSAIAELDSETVHLAGAESISGIKTFTAQPIGIIGSSIVNVPAGNILSANTQAAINELDSEKNVNIQFQEEGANLGTSGTINTVNFTGPEITATRSTDTLTVNVNVTDSVQNAIVTGNITSWKSLVVVNAAAPTTQTLPQATLAEVGKEITIKNIGTGTTTIAPFAGDTIFGLTSRAQNEAVTYKVSAPNIIQVVSAVSTAAVALDSLAPWAASEAIQQYTERTTVVGTVIVGMQSTSSRTTGASFNLAEALNWNYSGQSFIDSFPANTVILQGYQIIQGGQTYQSNSTRTTGATFDVTEQTNWTAFTATTSATTPRTFVSIAATLNATLVDVVEGSLTVKTFLTNSSNNRVIFRNNSDTLTVNNIVTLFSPTVINSVNLNDGNQYAILTVGGFGTRTIPSGTYVTFYASGTLYLTLLSESKAGVLTVNSTTAIETVERTVIYSGNSGNYTLTLPDTFYREDDEILFICYSNGSGVITLNAFGSNLIQGGATYTLSPSIYSYTRLKVVNGHWYIIGSSLGGTSNSSDTIQQINTTGNISSWGSIVEIGITPLSSNITLTLPTVIGNLGKTIKLVRVDNTAFTVTLASQGGQTLTTSSAGSELNYQNGALVLEATTSSQIRQVSNVSAVPLLAEYGELQIAQTGALAKTISFAAIPNTNVTVGTAGTYDIEYSICLTPFGGSTGETGWQIRLFNITTNTAVPNSVSNGSMDVTAQGTGQPRMFSKRVIGVTTTSAGNQFRLEAIFPSASNNYTISGNGAPAESGKISWNKIGGAIPVTGQTVDFIQANIGSTYSSNISAGDHIKFNTVESGNVFLDTSTAYNTTINTASLGRFTLIAGKTYKLSSTVAPTSNAIGGRLEYAWYNADTGTELGRSGASWDTQSTDLNAAAQGQAEAIFTPSVNTRVEVRIKNILNIGSIFVGGAALAGTRASIIQLGSSSTTIDYTSQYGEQILASTAASASFATINNGIFTLPTAGVWEVSYHIYYTPTEIGESVQYRIIKNSDNSVLNGSLSAVANTGVSGHIDQSVTQIVRIVTTGSESYSIQGLGASTELVWGGGTSIANSKVTWKKIAGFVPTTGQTVDFALVRRTSTNQTGIIINTDIIFNNYSSGNIPYNTTTGVFTLSSGKTYELKSGLKIRNDGTGTTGRYVQYEWVDASTNIAISGLNQGVSIMSTSTLNEGGSFEAGGIYTPSANQTVKVRITGIDGSNIEIDTNRAYAEIKQLGSSAVSTSIGGPLRVNGTTDRINGVYEIAMGKFSGNFEFYEDQYFRFDHNAGLLRATSVSSNRTLSAYGFNSGSANSTFPIITNAAFVGKGGYLLLTTGTFSIISDVAISSDYDDIQIYWLQTSSTAVKYRITILGGNAIGFIVERWDMSSLTLNTKITIV